MNLKGKTILIGVTGGIAAYKVCSLVSSLKMQEAEVYVAMTKNATEFVTPMTFETLSGNRVTVDMFDRSFKWEVEHISLAKKADICVIAPCTADFAAKLANGIADDFLSTTAMACVCPVLLAPAMNTNMLNSAGYRCNERILRERGVKFISSESGRLACGDVGNGRMAEPTQIESEIIDVLFPKKDFDGKTVLITAGGTIENVDPIRFLGNRSSGKMGLALAQSARERGANVIVVKANTIVSFDPSQFEILPVSTTKEMYDTVLCNLERADIIIKAAAPCDYRPVSVAKNKIKSDKLVLELEKTEDIAAAVGKKKGNKKLVVFAAETENAEANGQQKLAKKNADFVVINDVTKSGAGFGTDTNIATIMSKSSIEVLPLMSKKELADKILDKLAAGMK